MQPQTVHQINSVLGEIHWSCIPMRKRGATSYSRKYVVIEKGGRISCNPSVQMASSVSEVVNWMKQVVDEKTHKKNIPVKDLKRLATNFEMLSEQQIHQADEAFKNPSCFHRIIKYLSKSIMQYKIKKLMKTLIDHLSDRSTHDRRLQILDTKKDKYYYLTIEGKKVSVNYPTYFDATHNDPPYKQLQQLVSRLTTADHVDMDDMQTYFRLLAPITLISEGIHASDVYRWQSCFENAFDDAIQKMADRIEENLSCTSSDLMKQFSNQFFQAFESQGQASTERISKTLFEDLATKKIAGNVVFMDEKVPLDIRSAPEYQSLVSSYQQGTWGKGKSKKITKPGIDPILKSNIKLRMHKVIFNQQFYNMLHKYIANEKERCTPEPPLEEKMPVLPRSPHLTSTRPPHMLLGS